MSMNVSAENGTSTNCRLPAGTGAGDDKARKLSTAIRRVFQGHQVKFGSKTLTTIAWSVRS